MAKELLNEPIDVIEQKINRISPALLKILLKDNTTKENLHWATSTYEKYGYLYAPERQMLPEQLIGANGNLLTPRVSKTIQEQQHRTKEKGEVFTPAWCCNMMNNFLDEDWFGRKNVFNKEIDGGWKTNKRKVTFSKKLKKTWQDYVTDIRMEITCGEAPYLVSRYDVVKGEIIPVEDRIGILDRKLRIINENIDEEETWLEWAEIAYKSTYGYDFQGDNVLIARESLLYTLVDNMVFKFGHQPGLNILKKFAMIISWNIWQMDGLDYTIPFSEREMENMEIPLFDIGIEKTHKEKILAIIKNWDTNKNIEFKELTKGDSRMRFDYIVGNPPYQQETTNEISETNGQKPTKNVFHLFQMGVDTITNIESVLIYPGGRWIQGSGKGLSVFSKEQINDSRLNLIYLYADAKEVFPSIETADGISIVCKKTNKTERGFTYIYHKVGKEDVCVHLDNPGEKILPLNPLDLSIVNKIDSFVMKNKLKYMNERICPRTLFGIESDAVSKNPKDFIEYKNGQKLSYDDVLVFTNDKAGKAGRAKWFITNIKNIKNNPELISKWKVIVSSASAGGQKRNKQIEIIDSKSVFGRARVALGLFDTELEAKNFYEYCESNFIKYTFLLTDESLTTLGYRVPDIGVYLNNNGLIDFNKNIDEQLYELFIINNNERQHIEETVKEMK